MSTEIEITGMGKVFGQGATAFRATSAIAAPTSTPPASIAQSITDGPRVMLKNCKTSDPPAKRRSATPSRPTW